MISQELLLSFKCARCQKSRPSGLVGFQLRPRACVRYCTYEKYQDGERVFSRFMIKPYFALVFALHLASYNRHPESETELSYLFGCSARCTRGTVLVLVHQTYDRLINSVCML